MTKPGPIQWQALLNQAQAALVEQEQHLQNAEQFAETNPASIPFTRWQATRSRFRQALIQLSQLADHQASPTPYQVRRVLSGLELRGRQLNERWNALTQDRAIQRGESPAQPHEHPTGTRQPAGGHSPLTS